MSILQFILYTLLAALAYFFYWLRGQLTYWQTRGIACDPPNWLVGNFVGMRTTRSFYEIWLDTYNKFRGTGPFCGFYWFQKPAAFVLDRQLAKDILIKDFNQFTDRGFYSNERDDPLTGQLFLLDGHRWHNMRTKLTPTFTSGKMKYMFPTVIEMGAQFVRMFDEMLKQNAIVEVKDAASRFTIDVIGSCAFGLDCSSLKDSNNEFHIMSKRIFLDQRHGNLGIALATLFPNFCRRIHMKSFTDRITNFFMGIVRAAAEYRETHNIKRNDFFNLLLELKNNKMLESDDGTELKNLTTEEVAAQAVLFLFAGFETSATTMAFALYELAQHVDVQEKARLEVVTMLEKHKQEFSYECMKEMQYLGQIMSETLRLYTIVPVLNRQCLADYAVPGHPKYIIKQGMQVLIPAAAYHRDADVYADPEVFNPDNFTPEKVKTRDSVDWLPFGAGPRNCIGMRFGKMQTLIGLALLLKNFKFSTCPQTTIPMKYHKESFLVGPAEGIYLKVECISN